MIEYLHHGLTMQAMMAHHCDYGCTAARLRLAVRNACAFEQNAWLWALGVPCSYPEIRQAEEFRR
jgi:hypothetical protein